MNALLAAFERRVPWDFAPPIPLGHKLVGYRVEASKRWKNRGWKLRLRYAVLPEGICDRALAGGASRSSLAIHPDVYWTGSHPSFWMAPTGESTLSLDAKEVGSRPQVFEELTQCRRRSCVIPEIPWGQSGIDALVGRLDDPLHYHWEEIRSLIIGSLSTFVTDSAWQRQPARRRLRRLFHLIACVHAAKWILALPGNSLEPTEDRFSFPRDTSWLWFLMVSFGLTDHYGLGSDFLPWPSGVSSDDYPGGGTWLWDSIQDAWIDSYSGVWSSIRDRLDAAPPDNPQDFIDKVITLTGGYPKPHSVHTLQRLVDLTGARPPEAMSWVWADSHAPVRLFQDLGSRLLPLRLRLEPLLLDEEQPVRVPEWMVLDFVPLLRRFVRRLLDHSVGDRWMTDALTNKEQKDLAGLHIDNAREGTEFDYAELSLLKGLIERHWGKIFEPFFRYYSRQESAQKLTKTQATRWINSLIQVRNIVAHRRRELTRGERSRARLSYEAVQDLLRALDRYLASGPRP